MKKLVLASLLCFLGTALLAQSVQDMYKITDSKTKMVPEGPYDSWRYDQPPLAPGEEYVLADLEGPGKITYWYCTDGSPTHLSPNLVLKIFWDNEEEPSVNVPLTDFFGCFQGKTVDYTSYPMQVRENNYMCFLPMPFSKHAKFVIANEGEETYKDAFVYVIQYETGEEYANETSRLHCRWTRKNPVGDEMFTMFDIQGRGQYVGHFMQVTAPHSTWWGEGDMYYTVDGDVMMPSCGREDEYGSCWTSGAWHSFSGLFAGHPINSSETDPPEMEGKGERISVNRMYRWYCVNPIRFQESLHIELQNQSWIPSDNDYIAVVFWYQDGVTSVSLPPIGERMEESHPAFRK